MRSSFDRNPDEATICSSLKKSFPFSLSLSLCSRVTSIRINNMLEVTQVSLSLSSCQNNSSHHLPIPRRCLRRKWSLNIFLIDVFEKESLSFFYLSSTTDERSKDPPIDLERNLPLAPSVPGMDDAEFRRRGKEMIDYIADYLKHIR